MVATVILSLLSLGDNNLNVVYINVNGLGDHGDKLLDITDTYSEADIILLVETWMNNDTANELTCTGYRIYYRNRHLARRNMRRPSGGIMCLIKNTIYHYVELLESEDDDIMWLKLSMDYLQTNSPICLVVVYTCISSCNSTRHVMTNNDIHRALEGQIMELSNDGNMCVICGDFNGRTGTLVDYIEYDNEMYLPLDEEYIVHV